ncbi:MAG: DHA2 family efflux MFS transporter permease subunit [Trueperaceae bacterium]|nr:DHA2 family efflux MFS transporter permease subunit [Trueperaceae bacterium]
MPAAEPVLRTERREWVLAATSIGAFSASAMVTAVNVVLPTLVEELGAPFATVQWVVLGYLLASIALLPVIGRLADLWGKHRVFFAGYAAYALGSLACALAPDVGTLIAFRTVQGVGAAALTALGLAIVTDVFPQGERGRAIGINGAVISAGVVVGPSLGGLLGDLASWRWIFAAGVAIAAVGATLAVRVLPRYARQPAGRFDVLGGALIVAALLAFSLGLTLGQGRGFDAAVVRGLIAGGLALGVAFVAVERRVANPLVDLRLFRERDVWVGLASGSVTFVAIAGVVLLMPFYLEGVLGLPAWRVGLLMAVVPIVLVVAAPLAGTLADRFGPRPVTVAGMLLLLIGYLAVGTLDESTTPLGYVGRFLFVGLGMGTFQTPNNTAIMSAARRGGSGVAGSLLSLTRYLGQVIGTVGLGSLWAARTVARAGAATGTDATVLASAAQVAGLHDMLRVVQAIVLVGLVLVVGDLCWRRRAVPDGPVADARRRGAT